MYFKVGWEEGVWGGGHETLKIKTSKEKVEQ